MQSETIVDRKIAFAWLHLSDVYIANGEWQAALSELDAAREFFTSCKDYAGILMVLNYEIGIHGRRGHLHQVFECVQKMTNIFQEAGEPRYLRWYHKPQFDYFFWTGRAKEWENSIRPLLDEARRVQDNESIIWLTRDLGLALSMQDKCTEAISLLDESVNLSRPLLQSGIVELFIALTNSGMGLMRCGDFNRAEERLLEAVNVVKDLQGIRLDFAPRTLGILYEVWGKFEQSEHYYHTSLSNARQAERNTHIAAALTGLIRVKHAQGDYAAIPPLLAEAEQLAQQYEYNDHLASLWLTQAQTCQVFGNLTGLTTLDYFKQAMIYALRYNRFLLDEVLSGRPQGTPLRPIIPECLKRGEEGRQMLIALRDWWQTGVNDIGTPRPDTISPIPEGIPLLEAERIAREREPGDGSPQKSVVEQIEAALKNVEAG